MLATDIGKDSVRIEVGKLQLLFEIGFSALSNKLYYAFYMKLKTWILLWKKRWAVFLMRNLIMMPTKAVWWHWSIEIEICSCQRLFQAQNIWTLESTQNSTRADYATKLSSRSASLLLQSLHGSMLHYKGWVCLFRSKRRKTFFRKMLYSNLPSNNRRNA